MNATTWLSSKLNLLRNSAPAAGATPTNEDRSTRERLDATLRQKQEALSPRSLRRTLTLLQAVVDPRVSEVEGGRRAKALSHCRQRTRNNSLIERAHEGRHQHTRHDPHGLAMGEWLLLGARGVVHQIRDRGK